ncbi:hypothetical protein GCM10027422_43410 [Hymenobacter arcticus]
MANNFHLNYPDPNRRVYVSKAGSTSPDGSPEHPFSELPGGFSSMQCVVGTGAYYLPTHFGGGNPGYPDVDLLADGTVVVLGDGQSRFQRLGHAGTRATGFRFEQFAGLEFKGYYYGNPCAYTQCEFRVLPAFAGSPNSGATGSCAFADCVFINVHFSNDQTPGVGYNQGGNMTETQFTRCLFFNCTFTSPAASVAHCYLDATSAVWAATATANNVDPGCDPAAGHGLRVGSAGWARQVPDNQCADPQFHPQALALGDFSVAAGSPHLAAGIGPGQYRQGQAFLAAYQPAAPGQAVSPANTTFRADGATGPAPAPVALLGTTHAVLATGQGALTISPDTTTDGTAVLRTGAVPHGTDVALELTYLQALGGYNFNTSYPDSEAQRQLDAPSVFNNNVPTLGPYGPGEAGRNPARLTYGLRWSSKPQPDPTNPADWQPNHGQFVTCEWNTQPLYNSPVAPATDCVGNGAPGFDPAQARAVVCLWYQLELGLSNVYYH